MKPYGYLKTMLIMMLRFYTILMNAIMILEYATATAVATTVAYL
jgi:hypothetical protein